MDRDFNVQSGINATGVRNGLLISNLSRSQLPDLLCKNVKKLFTRQTVSEGNVAQLKWHKSKKVKLP